MKKVYALLLTVALAVTLVVPTIAAPSPSTEASAPASVVEVSVAGTDVAVLPDATKAEVASVTSNATHLTNLGVNTTAKLASSFDVSYSGEIPAGGVQIPIKVTTAKAGDYAYILHRDSVTGTWEKVGEGLLGADLTVVGTFTSFSPVAVMIVDAANVTTGVTAPKTGEF